MESIIIYSVAIILGLGLLTWSADIFVDGASGVAEHFGISPLVIGLTVVAFSTSAPEMVVSAFSSWQGNSGIAMGNAVGSNIANTTLVLGAVALIMPLRVGSQTLHREIPLLLAGMTLALVVLLWNDVLSRVDGIILMSAMISAIWLTIYLARKQTGDAAEVSGQSELTAPTEKISGQIIWWLVSGLVVIVLSAKLLVWGAVGVAEAFGVSDLVIGLTIVAVGTSLPELAASIAAIKKGEHDIAVGNVVGSSLFNILAVLGIVGIVGPGTFDHSVIVRDYPLMMGLVLVFYLITRRTPKDQSFVIQRWVGGALLLSFFVYQGVILFGASTS